MALPPIECVWDVPATFTGKTDDDIVIRVYAFENPAIPLSDLTFSTVETPEVIAPGDAFSYTQYITHISGLPDDFRPGRATMWINAPGQDTMDPTFRGIPADDLRSQMNELRLMALELAVIPTPTVIPSDLCTVTGTLYDALRFPVNGGFISFKMVGPPPDATVLYDTASVKREIGMDGAINVDMVRKASYNLRVNGRDLGTVYIPDQASVDIMDL